MQPRRWAAFTGGLIKVYGESSNKSASYGTIAVIFLFQGFYAFSITSMTSLYATEVSQFKLRSVGIAVFRFFDSSIGYVVLAFNKFLVCRLNTNISYAVADLSWKFYLINTAWKIMYLAIIYFTFVLPSSLTVLRLWRRPTATASLSRRPMRRILSRVSRKQRCRRVGIGSGNKAAMGLRN